MWLETALAAVLSFAAVMLLGYLAERLKRTGRGGSLSTAVIIFASDDAVRLQETLRRIKSISEHDGFAAEIFIADAGMNDEVKRAAGILAAHDEGLRLIKAAETGEVWQIMLDTKNTENWRNSPER